MITDLFGFISIISLNIFHLICFSLRYSSPTFLPSIELLKFTLYLFFSSTGLEVYILVTIFLKFLTNTLSFIFFFSKIYLLTWERDTDRQTDRQTLICCPTHLCNHRLILVCASDRESKLQPDVSGQCSNWATRPGLSFIFFEWSLKLVLFRHKTGILEHFNFLLNALLPSSMLYLSNSILIIPL